MYSNVKQHLEATISEIRDAGLYKSERAIDIVVRNVYKSNTGKTAAWTRASHIEKPPKKTETPTP